MAEPTWHGLAAHRWPASLALALTLSVGASLGAVASNATATTSARASSVPSVQAAALSRWTGGVNLYRSGVFTTQKTWLWCTAADIQIIRNMVRGTRDHSTRNQRRYFNWMRARNRYILPLSAGVDPQGWAAGMRHFVDGRYRLIASRSFDSALRLAVIRLRKTNLPVGVAVARGNHAWILHGFTATADPAVTSAFRVTSVRVTGPLYGRQSKNGYDMKPNTRLTVAQFRRFFTSWRYAPKRMIWDGRFVSIQPVTPRRSASATTADPAAGGVGRGGVPSHRGRGPGHRALGGRTVTGRRRIRASIGHATPTPKPPSSNLSRMADVADRVVLVTGATGGLGRVVAATFAAAGATLGLVGTDRDRLTAVAANLGLPEDRWAPAVADLTDPEAARAAVASVTERFGRVDVVLHLVGGWAAGMPVVELDRVDVRAMLDQHLWTTLNVVQAAVPGMVERGWGRIVAVSTTFAANPAAKGASYAISKGAEETLLRVLAREVGSDGVTANLVVVKKIDTDHERETAPSPKNATWTTPEEIAAVMRFLCTDDAAAINGARIPLDGRG